MFTFISLASIFSDPEMLISILGVLVPIYLHFHPVERKGDDDNQDATGKKDDKKNVE